MICISSLADKFKCLYLLVETAISVRQREKDHDEMYGMTAE